MLRKTHKMLIMFLRFWKPSGGIWLDKNMILKNTEKAKETIFELPANGFKFV